MIKQGEIWRVNLNPVIGDEIGKTRPVVVLSSDIIGRLQLKTVAPITQWSQQYQYYPWMIKIKSDKENGLSKVSAIDCFQTKSISTIRFVEKIGEVDDALLFRIHETILKVFNPKYAIK